MLVRNILQFVKARSAFRILNSKIYLQLVQRDNKQ